jgi:kynurenine formamidase
MDACCQFNDDPWFTRLDVKTVCNHFNRWSHYRYRRSGLLHARGPDPFVPGFNRYRKIKAIGIDAASIDYGQSKDFKTHQVFYAANIPGFEDVANLDKLPVKGSYIVALPMKIKGGSGAPLRIIAWVKN